MGGDEEKIFNSQFSKFVQTNESQANLDSYSECSRTSTEFIVNSKRPSLPELEQFVRRKAMPAFRVFLPLPRRSGYGS